MYVASNGLFFMKMIVFQEPPKSKMHMMQCYLYLSNENNTVSCPFWTLEVPEGQSFSQKTTIGCHIHVIGKKYSIKTLAFISHIFFSFRLMYVASDGLFFVKMIVLREPPKSKMDMMQCYLHLPNV